MSFYNENGLYVLLILIILVFISGKVKNFTRYFSQEMEDKIIIGNNKQKLNFVLLLASFIFLILALSRPVIENKPITVPKTNLDIVVAFDISKSMMCDDVYPNRLQFAKNKFDNLIENLKDENVGALGFSSRAFLVAPITNDYASLKYLISNLDTSFVSTKGSSTMEALKSTKQLLKHSKEKALIIFSDGTDSEDFSKEIEYAKEHKIKVFVYAIGTHKGGVIKEKDSVLKDENGNIVITRLNDTIKELALATDGAYLEHSTSKYDIAMFVNAINDKFNKEIEADIVINDNEELFYIPLSIALVLFILAISGFRREK
jgi:Ca-activated chloride channel family protein